MKDIAKLPQDIYDMYCGFIKNHQTNISHVLDNPRYLSDWAGKQAYIVLGNLMTVAAMLEIDSCPIEGFVEAEVSKILQEHNLIDPAEFEVTVMCALGYRVNPPRPKARLPIDELVTVY